MSARFNSFMLVTVVLGAILAAGCGQSVSSRYAGGLEASAPSLDSAHTPQSKAPVSAPARDSPSAPQDGDQAPIKLEAIADSEPDRYLIKNATITLEAGDVRAVSGRVIADAKTRKGYVSDLHETVDGLGARSVTFVVRVPFSQFDSFLQEFDTQGKILERQVNAEDITEEFVDTQSKVHNLRSTEQRLLTHLGQTGRLSDTLLVEKEINRVREEIDRLTGRLKFLAHRVAFSTFNVTVKETPHAQAITPAESFSAGKVVSDSARSLVAFGQQVFTLAIWLLVWSVVWLPPALIFGYLRWRRGAAPSRNL